MYGKGTVPYGVSCSNPIQLLYKCITYMDAFSKPNLPVLYSSVAKSVLAW